MKRRILSVILSASMLIAMAMPVKAEENVLPKVGETISGFTVDEVSESKTLDSEVYLLTHSQTGAKVIYIANDDTNRAFDIAFKTPGSDTGISHVFEHATLGGSKKYPKDIFFNLIYQTATTNMNAMTSLGYTQYFFSSISDDQLYNLADYYLDGVFNPYILTDKSIFDTEAWRYELEDADDELTLNGTVYSEMKGVFGSTTDTAFYNALKATFPNSCYAACSGGDPDVIPSLTFDEVVQYHEDYYKPSNSITTIYGKLNLEKYLGLLDEYFSQYDDQKPDVSDKNYTPVKGDVKKEFTIPGSGDPVAIYAVPLSAVDDEDLFGLLEITEIMAMGSSPFNLKMQEELPDVSIDIGVQTDATEPMFNLCALNIDEEYADTFKNIADESFEEIALDGFDEDILESYIASSKRAEAYSSQNLGIDTIGQINEFWSVTKDPLEYIQLLDYEENLSENLTNEKIRQLAEKYLVNADKKVLTVNIPSEELSKQKDTKLKNKLAQVKANMTDEEIAEIIAETTADTEDNTEENAELVKKVNVSNPNELKSEIENYKPKEYPYDTETVDNVRYLTAYNDDYGVSDGSIYIDISSATEEQLEYIALYMNILNLIPGKNYSQAELDKLSSRYFDGGQFIDNDDNDGLYYILDMTMLNEDVEKAYEIAYEALYNRDYSDVETLKSAVNILLTNLETSFESEPQSLIAKRAYADVCVDGGIKEYTGGLTFYQFLKDVSNELEENPQTVINHLDDVVNLLNNKYNATSIFVGNDESISKYKKASKNFFEKLPCVQHEPTKREYYVPNGSEAVVADGDVNYNLVAAKIGDMGNDYNGSTAVANSLITDKLLVPYLRYNKGAYGVLNRYNKFGMIIASYRDPQLKSTFDFYDTVADSFRELDITQDELDGYIASKFVDDVDFLNDFEDTYNYLTTLVWDNDEYELYYKKLNDYLNTTTADIKKTADVYDAFFKNGTKYTIGTEKDIIANADLYDTITIPFGNDEIIIYVDGERVDTDTAPVIENSRVLVPIAVISEALGEKVEWNAEEKSVTISSDDKNISLSIGEKDMIANGETINLDTAPEIINGRTMLPLRAVTEAFDKNVDWKTGCVIIK